jgi:hypothetical protein
VDLLQVVHEEFSIGARKPGDDYALKGIYSFLDIFGAERKTLDDYRELAAYGLKRIYIGLETGDDDLFALLNKPGSPLTVREALILINQTLDEVLAEQEGDFDGDTRWALAWFEQYGFQEGEYGVAESFLVWRSTMTPRPN